LWWLKVVATEFNFNHQSCGDQIYFQLPHIIKGSPNVWKIFLASVLMDMTSNANWLHHVCFNNHGHVGMNLMPLRVIGRRLVYGLEVF
jgi:hypothetical protein